MQVTYLTRLCRLGPAVPVDWADWSLCPLLPGVALLPPVKESARLPIGEAALVLAGLTYRLSLGKALTTTKPAVPVGCYRSILSSCTTVKQSAWVRSIEAALALARHMSLSQNSDFPAKILADMQLFTC